MKFRFSKFSGSESDYVIVDVITQGPFFSTENIRRLADRRTGIGFDYLILVEPPYDPDIDFHYRVFNATGEEVFFTADSAGCVANFVRAQGLSYKSTIPVSFVNGRLNLNVEKDSFVTVDFGEPIFEPEKIPFKAKQSEKTYIIRAADFNILCGVVSVSGPFCVVEEKDFSSERVNVIGKALSTHERFYDQAGVVFFKANSMDDIELHVYRNNTENKSANLFGACAACAVGINQGKLGNMVTVHIAGEHLKISWNGKGSSATFLACAVHVFDGDMEI